MSENLPAEIARNLLFLARNSAVPWMTAALFALLGLWFGHVLWYEWVRQLRPLRSEHRELRRRLDALMGVDEATPRSSPSATTGLEGATADGAATVGRPPIPVAAPEAEFWPIPEKAPEPTVFTGEVVPEKVRQHAARLVGIPLDAPENRPTRQA